MRWYTTTPTELGRWKSTDKLHGRTRLSEQVAIPNETVLYAKQEHHSCATRKGCTGVRNHIMMGNPMIRWWTRAHTLSAYGKTDDGVTHTKQAHCRTVWRIRWTGDRPHWLAERPTDRQASKQARIGHLRAWMGRRRRIPSRD